MRLFLVLFILNICCSAQAAAPTTGSAPSQSIPVAQENAAKAKTLIDQAIQALGGQAWLNIQDMTQQGRTYSFHRNEATSAGVLFWRFVKFPDKERVEVTKQRDVAYVYNGEHGYEITFKGTAAIEDKLDFHQGATRTAAHRKEGARTTLLAMITGTALVLVGIESLFR